MEDLTAQHILATVDRHLTEAAAAITPADQTIAVIEAVLWLWVLGDAFGALDLLAGLDRCRLNGLYHARHKGIHEAVWLSEPKDVYSDIYTSMYRPPVWAVLPAAAPSAKNQAEEADYKQLLEGHLVLESLQPLAAALHAHLS